MSIRIDEKFAVQYRKFLRLPDRHPLPERLKQLHAEMETDYQRVSKSLTSVMTVDLLNNVRWWRFLESLPESFPQMSLEPVNWDQVEKGTPVVVSEPGTEPRQGTFAGFPKNRHLPQMKNRIRVEFPDGAKHIERDLCRLLEAA